MSKTVTIRDYILIESASKTVDYATKKLYDHNKDRHFSEWAMACTLAHFKIGEKVPINKFKEVLAHAKLQQMLDQECEEGRIEAVWVDDKQEIGYRITPKGAKFLSSKKRKQ